MGISFGASLRAQRLARGMDQAQVSGGEFPPSYISLLELGRREPTPEVIRQLARQLEMAPETLGPWNRRTDRGGAECILAGLSARQAWDARDYPEAARQAAAAAELALAGRNHTAWWDSTYLRAESLMKQDQLAEARAIAGDLLMHRFTERSCALTVRSRQMLAALCLGLGRLTEALAHAREAFKASAPLPPDSPIAIAALNSLIAALAESGRLDQAWGLCRTLADRVADESLGQAAGEAAWTIGNVAFMRGDAHEGSRHHERAARLLSPVNDLNLWARFNRASAASRLAGGIVEPETLAALERAEIAFSIVGANRVERLEVTLTRAHWLHLTGQHAEAVEHLEAVMAGQHLLGHHTAGEAAFLHGLALAAAGRQPQAVCLLREAYGHYTAAGLIRRARAAKDAISKNTHRVRRSGAEPAGAPARLRNEWRRGRRDPNQDG
ncbi:helix-turn-helix domain-containing protein [Sinomonas sp. P47F7]|uniref:helix-turn-helix domain-containing protein n=1 Tax=Sinomonas sp. P47F7 TaxID=3410987 RepID=UPI003BF4A76D